MTLNLFDVEAIKISYHLMHFTYLLGERMQGLHKIERSNVT